MAKRSNPALSKPGIRNTSSETVLLNRTRAQRIPSSAKSNGSQKGRIHLRRPNRHLHFSLAKRRRTIHSGLATTQELTNSATARSPTRTSVHLKHCHRELRVCCSNTVGRSFSLLRWRCQLGLG